MRIELCDESRRWLGSVAIAPAQRPTRVTLAQRRAEMLDGPVARVGGFVQRRLGRRFWRESQAEHAGVQAADAPPPATTEAFLNWDNALDDAGQLRRCVACGCPDLFHERAFPQITAIIVALAFAGAIIGALGMANSAVLAVMVVVLALDVAILIFSKRRLACYRCRTTYSQAPIARYHRPWDRAIADRYPAPLRRPGQQQAADGSTASTPPLDKPASPAAGVNVPAGRGGFENPAKGSFAW